MTAAEKLLYSGGAAVQVPLSCAQCAGSSCNLLCDDFEGTTLCYSGGNSNCRQAWSTAGNGGTINTEVAASSIGMYGNYAVSLTNGSLFRQDSVFSGQSTVYFLMPIRVASTPQAAAFFMEIRDSAGQCAGFEFYVGGEYGVQAVGGTQQYSGSSLVAGNTTYWFRGSYTKGSGSNAIAQMSRWNTSTKSWDAYTLSNNGTSTNNPTSFWMYINTYTMDFDNIKFSSTEYVNAPNTY